MSRAARWFAPLLLASAFVSMLTAAAPPRPVVESAAVDAIIHPVTSEFMRTAIARADADGAALIVFTLHTPGGLLDSTRDINNAIIAREDAGRGLRRPGRLPRGLRRLSHHHGRRRRGDGARNPHRRCAPRRRGRARRWTM